MSKELMIERIEKAQKEIEAKREKIQQGKFRQNYHFMAETGWINDPNGLIYFKGKYHFFYQYNPYSGFWDCMHWGHAVSEDMIHWEYLPLALAPSEVYDDHLKGGCFSGSAIEHDGKLFLIYTGTCNNGNGFEQAQCIAYSEDGIHFEKYEGNPVITAPEGVPTDLFRDPKVWKHDDTYYVVCGASKNGFAQARLYKSTDMFHWEFVNVLAESRGEWGYMWECPDFFTLEGQEVLSVSPQGLTREEFRFQNIYQSGYFILKAGKPEEKAFREWDHGFDFYAPQTMETEDGRRILIGWMQSWDNPMYPDTQRYSGMMTVPRELSMKGGRICQKPVRELENYRSNVIGYDNVCIHEETELKGISGRSIDLQIALKGNEYGKFRIKLAADEKHYSEIIYDKDEKTLTFDRTHSGFKKDTISTRSMYVSDKKDVINLRILVDRFSVEIFVNDGEQVMTSLIYTPVDASGISFASNGNTHLDVTKYDIEVK